MGDSILDTVKKMLGLNSEYSAFDVDITVLINSVFLSLSEIGVGPKTPFAVEGPGETWIDFLGEEFKNFRAVITYVYLKVKIVFDPPASQAILTAYTNTISELEWRLKEKAEGHV